MLLSEGGGFSGSRFPCGLWVLGGLGFGNSRGLREGACFLRTGGGAGGTSSLFRRGHFHRRWSVLPHSQHCRTLGADQFVFTLSDVRTSSGEVQIVGLRLRWASTFPSRFTQASTVCRSWTMMISEYFADTAPLKAATPSSSRTSGV